MNCILKYPGAKWSIAEWVISHFPPHRMYLEPFFGSGAVLFAKEPSVYETVNDLDGMVVNYFKAVRDHPIELAKAIDQTPYARQEYYTWLEPGAGQPMQLSGDCVEDARRFAVRCFQGFGSKTADRVGWKNTRHSNGPVMPRVWDNVPETILIASHRLKQVQIECTEATDLIRAYNSGDCLIYADPPYLGESRDRKRIYRNEMMDPDSHRKLLEVLLCHSGPVVLSGYDNRLYNDMLRGWEKVTTSYQNNIATRREECLWLNFQSQTRLY